MVLTCISWIGLIKYCMEQQYFKLNSVSFQFPNCIIFNPEMQYIKLAFIFNKLLLS